MSTENYREYIQKTYINHLERLMGHEVTDGGYYRGERPQKDYAYTITLHTKMLPYYEQYLKGDLRLCCEGCKLEPISHEMERIILEDDMFGRWASEQDLIVAAECWGDNMKRYEKEGKRIYRFFNLLTLLLKSDCQKDWVAMSEELKEMLFKAEVCYDYKTDEVLCILHAFTMIMQQSWPKEKKLDTFDLLNQHWMFMKYYYSVMIRHIIGVKYTQFDKVAETVLTKSQSFKPHMHIFYCGLMDLVDELHLDKKHQREMDRVVNLMQEELNRVKEPSELLYELCDTIFPEDFQRLLREHRPKSYKEMEDESRRKDELIREWQDQAKRMRTEYEKTRDVLEQMIATSIPVEKIDKELEKYPPATAFDLLRDLINSPVLDNIDAWHNNYRTLLEKYRSKLFEPVKKQDEQMELMKKAVEKPTTIKVEGDYNLEKKVENEVDHVEKGAIGIKLEKII